MIKKIKGMILTLLFCSLSIGFTASNQTELAVWANEAIIATYTYDYKNFLEQQKGIAKYFTAQAWINYLKALNDSKVPEAVEKNSYTVSSVATQPPQIQSKDATHWQATMPILVVYKNTQYQQQQHLNIVISFTEAPSGQGIRGLAITNIKSSVSEPLCTCCK